MNRVIVKQDNLVIKSNELVFDKQSNVRHRRYFLNKTLGSLYSCKLSIAHIQNSDCKSSNDPNAWQSLISPL